MGTEDQIFKGTKLITNTKKQRLKIQSRGWILKNTILKEKKFTKIIKHIYMKFALKKQGLFFFAKQQQVIKMKIKGVIEDLKFKKNLKNTEIQ